MKVYIAHNITASQGGNLIGIFSDYEKAKSALLDLMGWQDGTVDWSHFIRVATLNEIKVGLLSYEKS